MKHNESFGIGDSASMSKTVTEQDINGFAAISGDMNPVHTDEEYARTTVFGGRIAHGMLMASFIGAVMAMKLPGPGAIYQEQTLNFQAPVRIGDTVTTTVEIVELDGKKKRARLRTVCTNQDGVIVVDGSAVIRMPRHRSS